MPNEYAKDIADLRLWFLSQSRDLPWRQNPTPYKVWVSEVMLQQTQVSVVIPYFDRWMQQFPDIKSLADAPLESVIKAWEGLGYYSRARNLHEGAKYIVAHFNGNLPNNAEDLIKIKGLGSYTVGAILSFAFHQRAAAVDGNVMRVLARYYALADDIAKSKTTKKIQALTLDLLPEKEPWVIAEALIELGATVCAKQPKCSECPLKSGCQALAKGMIAELPVKSAGAKTTHLYRSVAVINHENTFLIGTGAKGKVMADLCEFPYIDIEAPSEDHQPIKKHLETTFNLKMSWKKPLPKVKHSFTRYQAQLLPHFFNAIDRINIEGYRWVTLEELKQLPFSSGHRRILASLKLF